MDKNDNYWLNVEAMKFFFSKKTQVTKDNSFLDSQENLNFPQIQYCITFLQ